jgi:hypothetical protein
MQKLILYSLFLIFICHRDRQQAQQPLWVKAVSYGTTAINIPAFTGNSYQYDPSKKKHTS